MPKHYFYRLLLFLFLEFVTKNKILNTISLAKNKFFLKKNHTRFYFTKKPCTLYYIHTFKLLKPTQIVFSYLVISKVNYG